MTTSSGQSVEFSKFILKNLYLVVSPFSDLRRMSFVLCWIGAACFPLLPAGVVESLLDGLEAVFGLQPGFDLRRLAGRGQLHHGSSGHAVSQDAAAGSASQLQQGNI